MKKQDTGTPNIRISKGAHELTRSAADPREHNSPREYDADNTGGSGSEAAGPLIGEVDQTQINMWKNRFRRVYGIIVPDGGERHVGYFRRPDMDVLAAANRLRRDDEVKAVNVMFENCWLGGSEVMRSDAIVKMGAMARFNAALAVQQAELKNL